MLKTILIPLDGSDRAEAALALAGTLSIPTAARLVLVRVRARAEADHVEQYLEETVDGLRQRGFRVDSAALTDSDVPNAIVKAAAACAADLIVMTTHGRTGPARWLLGSVAQALVTLSPAPIMLQRAWDPGRRAILLDERPRVLVPVDGSKLAEVALPAAVSLVDDLGGEMILLRVDPTTRDVVLAEGDVAAYMDGRTYAPLAVIQDYLAELVERVRAQWPDVRVSSHIDYGDPATAIAETTRELHAAIVIMATHGRTGMQRMTLGSVADAVLHRGAAPLVLVGPAACSGVVERQRSAP